MCFYRSFTLRKSKQSSSGAGPELRQAFHNSKEEIYRQDFLNLNYSSLNLFSEIVHLPERTRMGQKIKLGNTTFTQCEGGLVQVTAGVVTSVTCVMWPATFLIVLKMVVKTIDSASQLPGLNHPSPNPSSDESIVSPWTSSIRPTRELVMQIPRPHSRLTKSDPVGVGPRIPVVMFPPGDSDIV